MVLSSTFIYKTLPAARMSLTSVITARVSSNCYTSTKNLNFFLFGHLVLGVKKENKTFLRSVWLGIFSPYVFTIVIFDHRIKLMSFVRERCIITVTIITIIIMF